MEDVYVARQPIFDKNKHIYAYELLFRDGTANHVPDIDGDEATTTLLAILFSPLAWTRWPGVENCLSITPRTFWKRKSLSCCPKKPR
jgi:c-di-GMP-related signal transduction protein